METQLKINEIETNKKIDEYKISGQTARDSS